MNRTKFFSLMLLSVFTSLQLNTTASADHRVDPYVNYDLLCKHAEGLKYISVDLKNCFSDQFRQSRYYGKLISRTAKIKHTASRLHRHGLSQKTCNWRYEIQRLDDLVCELAELVDHAVSYGRTGYGTPSCAPAPDVRKVRSLLGKAEYHVRGLEGSLRGIERTNRGGPIYNEPAPGYFPNQGVGYGVKRTGSYGTSWDHSWDRSNSRESCGNDARCNDYSSRSNRFYDTRGQSYTGFDYDRSGIALNLGGFRFQLN